MFEINNSPTHTNAVIPSNTSLPRRERLSTLSASQSCPVLCLPPFQRIGQSLACFTNRSASPNVFNSTKYDSPAAAKSLQVIPDPASAASAASVVVIAPCTQCVNYFIYECNSLRKSAILRQTTTKGVHSRRFSSPNQIRVCQTSNGGNSNTSTPVKSSKGTNSFPMCANFIHELRNLKSTCAKVLADRKAASVVASTSENSSPSHSSASNQSSPRPQSHKPSLTKSCRCNSTWVSDCDDYWADCDPSHYTHNLSHPSSLLLQSSTSSLARTRNNPDSNTDGSLTEFSCSEFATCVDDATSDYYSSKSESKTSLEISEVSNVAITVHIGTEMQFLQDVSETPLTYPLQGYNEEVFEKFFLSHNYADCVCQDTDIGIVVVSLKLEPQTSQERSRWVRILVRTDAGVAHGIVPINYEGCVTYDDVAELISQEMKLSSPLRLTDIRPESFLELDRAFIKSTMKLGVLYVKEDQQTEDIILSNQGHSEQFENFLSILGDKVDLKGFQGYSGGLDTVNDQTGKQSVYTKWRNLQIMFHVSTLLPFDPHDSQKLQRKRHIGNDILCIVFLEAGGTKFSPKCIRSHFLHSFIVVQCEPNLSATEGIYNIEVVSRSAVPMFEPNLPETKSFPKNDPLLREWILSKCVNGERASYTVPKFSAIHGRTRSQGLRKLYDSLPACTSTNKLPVGRDVRRTVSNTTFGFHSKLTFRTPRLFRKTHSASSSLKKLSHSSGSFEGQHSTSSQNKELAVEEASPQPESQPGLSTSPAKSTAPQVSSPDCDPDCNQRAKSSPAK